MRFRIRNLIPFFYISLPFFGFSIFNIGKRGIRIDWAVMVLFCSLMAAKIFMGERDKIKVDSVILSLALLMFLVSFSIFSPILSNNQQLIIEFLTTYLQFLMVAVFFIFAYNLKFNYSELNRILKYILVISGLISGFAILQLVLSHLGYELRLPFTNPGRAAQHSGYSTLTGSVLRSMGTFSEPRQLGAYLLTGMAISVSLWQSRIRLFRRKYLQGIFFLLIFLGILSSLSTSAILNMIVFLLFFFFFELFVKRGFLRKRVLIRTILFCCFLAILIFSIFVSSIWEVVLSRVKLPEVENIYENVTQVKSKAHRWGGFVRGQRMALETFGNNPIAGVGLNNYQNYVEKNYEGLIGPRGCHGPLSYLAQTGMLGILGGIMFICSLFNKLFRKRRSSSLLDKNFGDLGIILIFVSFLSYLGSGLFGFASSFLWGNFVLVGIILNSGTTMQLDHPFQPCCTSKG